MKIRKIIPRMLLALVVGLFVLAFASGCSVFPAGEPVEAGNIVDVISKITAFLGDVIALGAAAALVTMLIQLGKLIGFVKDDTARIWSLALNGLLLAALVYFKIVNPDLLPATVDAYVRTLSSAAVLILGFLGIQLPASSKLFEANRGAPLIGYSITEAKG